MQEWNEPMVSLAATIRSGREATVEVPEHGGAVSSVAIECAELGGSGVEFNLGLDGLRLRAWCDERAWCDWLAPMLAVPHFAAIPEELRLVLGSWSLLPLGACAAQAALAEPMLMSLRQTVVEPAPAWSLTLRRDAASLRLRLLDWPPLWLEQLALSLSPVQPLPAAVERVPMALAAGYVQLTKAQIDRIFPGSAVLLDIDARVEHGEAILFCGKNLVRINYLNEEEWKVNDTMTQDIQACERDLQQNMDRDPDQNAKNIAERNNRLDSLSFSVVAEIGRIELTLEEMRTLESGMILGAPTSFDGIVSLRVQGKTIAKGKLLRIGERLAVRVE